MLFWFSALRGDVHPRGEGIRQRCSSDHARYPCGQPGKPTVSVKIKASKTDPFHQGVLVYVGRTNQPLCPVSALLAYMVRRGNRPGPLFIFQDGRPLTRPHFVTEVRKTLLAAGNDPKPYSGHSFRIGAAITAGVEDPP